MERGLVPNAAALLVPPSLEEELRWHLVPKRGAFAGWTCVDGSGLFGTLGEQVRRVLREGERGVG